MDNTTEFINGREVLKYDFQGWPMFKQTVQDLLNELGIEIKSIKDKSVLTKQLVVMEDDGMAYCAKGPKFVTDVFNEENEIQFWF